MARFNEQDQRHDDRFDSVVLAYARDDTEDDLTVYARDALPRAGAPPSAAVRSSPPRSTPHSSPPRQQREQQQQHGFYKPPSPTLIVTDPSGTASSHHSHEHENGLGGPSSPGETPPSYRNFSPVLPQYEQFAAPAPAYNPTRKGRAPLVGPEQPRHPALAVNTAHAQASYGKRDFVPPSPVLMTEKVNFGDDDDEVAAANEGKPRPRPAKGLSRGDSLMWKRFSTAAHLDRAKDSEWLKKQSKKSYKLKALAWFIVLVIVAAIAGGVAYKVTHKSDGDDGVPDAPGGALAGSSTTTTSSSAAATSASAVKRSVILETRHTRARAIR